MVLQQASCNLFTAVPSAGGTISRLSNVFKIPTRTPVGRMRFCLLHPLLLQGGVDDVDMQLAAMNNDESQQEMAEAALELNIDVAPEHPDAVGGGPPISLDANIESGGKDDGESDLDAGDVWEFTVSEDTSFHELKEMETTGDSEQAPVSQASASGTFKHMAAFMFLEQVGLTELPNVPGVGIGVHLTIKSWQVRYPAETGQQSAARCYGQLKKQWVPPCRALLQCLLWCWEVHSQENPLCEVSESKITLLKGAIKADLGRDVL